MNITTQISAPWVIIPDKLIHICDLLDAHVRGPKLNLKDLEDKILSNAVMKSAESSYYVADGIAVFVINGPIVKNADIFDRVIYGMVSSSMIGNDIIEAVNDSQIKGILLYIDSPGGTVDGTQELARIIYNSRGKKPIITYSDGFLTSGAYWVGSAADKIYISGDTINVGSIGVIRIHREWSKNDQEYGITTTEFVSGKYKNASSPNTPLTKDIKAYHQEQVDYVFSIFINDVALFRGITTEQAIKMSDEARIYIGQQAIEAGLVDGVSTMEDLINKAGGVPAGGGMRIQSSGETIGSDDPNTHTNPSTEEAMAITRETLAKEFPDLLNAIIDEGKKLAIKDNETAVHQATEDGKKIGAAAELERIRGIKAQVIPGHEALAEQMMFDGKTSPAEAAMAFVQAEKKAREANLNAQASDAPPPVRSDEPPAAGSTGASDNRPIEIKAKEQWDKDSKLRAEFHENYESYLAYVKNADHIRIKGGDLK